MQYSKESVVLIKINQNRTVFEQIYNFKTQIFTAVSV